MDKMLFFAFTAACLQVTLGVFTLVGNPMVTEGTAAMKLNFTVDPASLVDATDLVPFRLTANITPITTDAADLSPVTPAITGVFNAATSKGEFGVSILTVDDLNYEGDETFTLSLSTGAGMAVVATEDFNIILKDDDLPPLPLKVPSNVEVMENVGTYTFSILLRNGVSQSKDVVFSVMTEGVDDGPGTQAADISDYTPLNMIAASIPAGQTRTEFDLVIADDATPEYPECIKVTLFGPGIVMNYTFNICILDNDQPMHFDCRRPGQGCMNGGTCNDVTKKCDCTVGFTFVDCSVPTAEIMPSCAITCNATHTSLIDGTEKQNGLCVTTPLGEICRCYPGWTGIDCSVSAFRGECMPGGGISFCIIPYGNFAGNMKVGGVDSCELSSIPSATCTGYNGEFDFVNELGCNATESNTGGTVSWEMDVEILYSQSSSSLFREDLIVACSSSPAGIVTIDFGNVDVDTTPAGVDTVTQNPPLRLDNILPVGTSSVVDQGLTSITPDTPVVRGTRLTFCLSISESQFNGFNFWDIIMTNALDAASPMFDSRILMNDGCKAPGAALLLDPIPINDDNTPHYQCFDFYADKLAHTNMIEIVGSVKLFSTIETFVPEVCVARKRRQATAGVNDEQGSVRFLVSLKEEEFIPVKDAVTACERSLMMPAAIGLGIVCLTLLIVVVLLAAILIRHRSTKQKIIS